MHSLFLATSWTFIFSTISSVSTLLPAMLGIWSLKRQEQPLRFLTVLLIFTCIVEVIARVLIMYKTTNLPLLHLYVPIQFALLACMYQLYLRNIFHRYLIPVIILAFSLYSIINSLLIRSVFVFNAYARAIENLLIIILALAYFYKMLIELKVRYLEKHPMFWINSGVLIYFSGSLFLFIFSNYSILYKSISQLTWISHAFLNISTNIFYAIGLWLSRQNSE